MLGGQGATLPLPDIHLTNLGTGAEGITPAELSEKVLSAVLNATTKVVAENATKIDFQKAASGVTDLFKKK
jgi:hypothetical protein